MSTRVLKRITGLHRRIERENIVRVAQRDFGDLRHQLVFGSMHPRFPPIRNESPRTHQASPQFCRAWYKGFPRHEDRADRATRKNHRAGHSPGYTEPYPSLLLIRHYGPSLMQDIN